VIFGKVGGLGHGKSMRMVVDGVALCTLRGGLRGRCWLASNIKINTPEGMRFTQLPMDGFSAALAELMAEALAAGVGLVVLVDEIDTVWDAHEWQSMRKGDRYRIKQSRKYGCDLFFSAQFVDQIEKSIRNITEEVELVRAFPGPSIRRRERGKRPWVIRGQRFRPGAVREIIGPPDKDKRLGRTIHRYRRADELLYDTDEIIMPADLEALCARHSKEEREARCPRCNPPAPTGLAAFALAAAESAAADQGRDAVEDVA
jgi:hypothetical protein